MPTTYGIPAYLLGKNVTIAITPLDMSACGVLSNNAIGTLTLNGRVDNDDFELAYTTENISPRDAFNSNPVPYEVGSTFTITEIAQAWPLWTDHTAVWCQGNTLETCARKSVYHYIQIAALENDLTTVFATWTGICLLSSHRRSSPKGKNTYTATFQTILATDTSTGNFVSNPGTGTGS